jgi:hypothetical protein
MSSETILIHVSDCCFFFKCSYSAGRSAQMKVDRSDLVEGSATKLVIDIEAYWKFELRLRI